MNCCQSVITPATLRLASPYSPRIRVRSHSFRDSSQELTMAGQMEQMGAILGQQLMKTAEVIIIFCIFWTEITTTPCQIMEDQVDAEMKKLESMDEDDLEALKKRRIEMMKKQQEKKQEWLAQGHGEYSEIPEEKVCHSAFFQLLLRMVIMSTIMSIGQSMAVNSTRI